MERLTFDGNFCDIAQCRELLTREHPDAVGTNYAGGCMGCPKNYGYEPENKPCPHQYEEWRKSGSLLCAACWDRVVPGSAER